MFYKHSFLTRYRVKQELFKTGAFGIIDARSKAIIRIIEKQPIALNSLIYNPLWFGTLLRWGLLY